MKQIEKEERFGVAVLDDRVFSVDWDKTETQLKERKGRWGGTYPVEEKYLHMRIKGYSNTSFVVGPFYEKDYTALRMLALSGIKAFSCSRELPDKEGGYAKRVFAGAEVF
jgi:hypothetical protein